MAVTEAHTEEQLLQNKEEVITDERQLEWLKGELHGVGFEYRINPGTSSFFNDFLDKKNLQSYGINVDVSYDGKVYSWQYAKHGKADERVLRREPQEETQEIPDRVLKINDPLAFMYVLEEYRDTMKSSVREGIAKNWIQSRNLQWLFSDATVADIQNPNQ